MKFRVTRKKMRMNPAAYTDQELRMDCEIPPAPAAVAQSGTDSPPATGTTEQCQDEHERCGEWARRGECHVNPDYMLLRCRGSCGVCSPDCADKRDACRYWASIGECSKNPDYMLVNCKRSCADCSS